jgi:hypothetical protein
MSTRPMRLRRVAADPPIEMRSVYNSVGSTWTVHTHVSTSSMYMAVGDANEGMAIYFLATAGYGPVAVSQ